MSEQHLANWIALYLATAICCSFAFPLAVVSVALEMWREEAWRISSWKDGALLLPRAWWRWQKRYLMSTPLTLAIVGSFALSLPW